MLYFIIGVLAIIAIVLGIQCYQLKHQQQEVIQINAERQKENTELEIAVANKRNELQNIKNVVEAQNNILKSLTATENNLRAQAQENAQAWYEAAKNEFDRNLQEYQNNATLECNQKLDNLNSRVVEEQQKLKNLEDKQLAYIQAQQRQQEIDEQQDYYRLVISALDVNDIELLRELQIRFVRKEVIDKVIWETYFKPAYDVLMSHLFTDNNKTCGIYKITNLTNGQAYIGQSVDIKERFRQHIKTSLQYGNATNKLYQQMQQSGQQNFTFEILEMVKREDLNEREQYWINFYHTKEYGMNKTVGGS